MLHCRFPASLHSLRLAAGAFVVLASAAWSQEGAVYTMTNATAGNEILACPRDGDGALGSAVAFATGGTGTGAGLGNQSSVVLSADERWLLAVNPGDSTISVFAVRSDGLELVETVDSGGVKPVSVAVHGRLVAVLHAGGDTGDKDSLSMLRLDAEGHLTMKQRHRSLSASTTAPAQVAFVNDGHIVVVTEKDTNRIDTFEVRPNGKVGTMTTHDSAGPKPFGFAIGERDQIFVSEATNGSLTSYLADSEGGLTAIESSVATNQQATCWVVASPGARFLYTVNSASATLSGFSTAFDGSVELLDPTGSSATTDAAPVDAALTDDGRFLYVLSSGAHTLNAFHRAEDGTLEHVSDMTGLPDTANGLAAR